MTRVVAALGSGPQCHPGPSPCPEARGRSAHDPWAVMPSSRALAVSDKAALNEVHGAERLFVVPYSDTGPVACPLAGLLLRIGEVGGVQGDLDAITGGCVFVHCILQPLAAA